VPLFVTFTTVEVSSAVTFMALDSSPFDEFMALDSSPFDEAEVASSATFPLEEVASSATFKAASSVTFSVTSIGLDVSAFVTSSGGRRLIVQVLRGGLVGRLLPPGAPAGMLWAGNRSAAGMAAAWPSWRFCVKMVSYLPPA
jgi:hypothetical protein